MRNVFNGLLVAVSMYSRIPMPQKLIKWDDDGMKYSICFFPIVGVVIGTALLLWRYLCELLGFGEILFAAVAAAIPIFITGGIHMDGYCDTIDALSSYQPMERKLEILKDPNAGAFAVIKACVYFLLYFAFMTRISYSGIIILAIGFVFSRSLSGLAVVNFKSANKSGLAAMFKERSHKQIVTVVLLIIFAACVTAMFILADVITAAAAVVSAAVIFLYYKHMAYKQFGGVTGDIAGYFLVKCELWMLVGIVLIEGVMKLWN